ncbi:MAG: oligosaccharide flippase family protein [Peptostreptococcaceae bacterium]|nr:oligosaccharide flippase family protein [Peptostreptococcaceae bacterium]MDY5739546.1 oligosaccharide flippase family protein [Anaerovoracaceae bacterium]
MSKFIRNIGGFSLGPIVGAVLAFITVPIVTYFITPEEYGKASMFILAQSTLSIIIFMGMDQAFVREFNLFKDNLHKLLINAMLIPMTLAVILSIVTCIFASRVSNILFNNTSELLAVYSLALLMPFMVIGQFSLLKIRMEEKAFTYSFFTILSKIFILLLTVLFLFKYEASFRSVVYAIALSEVINGCILYALVLRHYRFKKTIFDKTLQVTMIKFGLPLVPAFAIGWILTSMDKVMLRTMCTYEELGLYSAAFKIVSVLSILQTCFTLYWAPVAYRWYEEKKDNINFERVSWIVSALMVTTCMGVLLFKDLVAIILGPSFKEAINIFPFLLLYPVLYTISETTSVGIAFLRKTSYNVVISIASGVTNILLNWVMIPSFGGIGAAIATGLSYVVFFWGRTLISRNLWHKKMRISPFIYVTGIVVANCYIHTFMSGYIPYVITSITMLVTILIIVWFSKKFHYIRRLKSGELF